MIVPLHGGGLETTGPVGVIAFPQLSLTVGGVGTKIELKHAAVAFVGAIGAKGR